MLVRQRIETHEEWLKARTARGIGASQAAACVGMSPWQTPTELWKELTGAAKKKNLDGNEAIEKGKRLEPAIRTMFEGLHPEMKIEYAPYDLLYQDDRPYAFATLDGEAVFPNEERAVLEIKTSTPTNRAKWAEWKEGVPIQYYWQVLHQLLVTGYDKAYLFACLFSKDGDITLRTYEFERSDFSDDLAWLKSKEDRFWESVKNKTLPSATIIF